MPGVRTVIQIGANFSAAASHEAPERPVAATHRETPGAGIVELAERADHALDIDLALSHDAHP
jgi:hypothetical protein